MNQCIHTRHGNEYENTVCMDKQQLSSRQIQIQSSFLKEGLTERFACHLVEIRDVYQVWDPISHNQGLRQQVLTLMRLQVTDLIRSIVTAL